MTVLFLKFLINSETQIRNSNCTAVYNIYDYFCRRQKCCVLLCRLGDCEWVVWVMGLVLV